MPRLTASDLPPRYQAQLAAKLYEAKNRRPLPHAKPECNASEPLERAAARKEKGVGRVGLRFVGYRVRLLDPDGFAGSTKHFIDGLRAAGIIRDDTTEHITLETSQVRVATFAEERTEIEIDLP